jgi:hypothetical protein
VIDELDLTDDQAKAIINKAIEFEVYSDKMPGNKKERLGAAHEIVSFGIDSWVDDEITPDAEDDDAAAAGKQIAAIFELAGVSIDDENNIEYGDPPDADDEEDEGDEENDDESAFDINDAIEDYEDLSAAARVKAIKALELDLDDVEDYNTLVGIAEWEEAQDKPSSRVLSYINDLIPPEGDEPEEEDEEADDETADEAGDDSDDDGDDEDVVYDETTLMKLPKEELKTVAEEFEVEWPKRVTDAGRKRVVAAILAAQEEADSDDDDEDGEPWEGYDDAKIAEIKKALTEKVEDEEDPLTGEQVQYLVEYEEARETPRKALLKFYGELLSDDEEEEEDEPEEEPVKTTARRGRRGTKSNDPDESDDVDNAVARDDEKETRKNGKKGGVVLTREDILTALAEGKVTLG